jgi:SNF2 family DNA or RNA helicase
MIKLEDLKPKTIIKGLLSDMQTTVVSVQWFGSDALELTYKTPTGKVANEILYRHDEARLDIVEIGRPWSFDGDGSNFRLVSEAIRINLAHLFDPVLAVHTSLVEPLPHQITAVYETMLPRQPLRFLLADDPGAGKTIMAGLLIKELIARGDLQRCLIVCPGSLAEQWQDELYTRFQLPFEILTNDKLEASRTGNWFLESNLVIARLDKLSRNEDVQEKLKAPDCQWDLIVCDEAHKMSASFFGGEVNYTKRYRLGQLLSSITRHFLLMSATPHSGIEANFQLFMALLDGDRFEGKFRDGVHAADVSDLIRRMVKENLVKFDGTPLFPQRIAYTMEYKLSDPEEILYKTVSDYVREEFNRAEALENDKRAGTVGFALTILQRRLASSPEAIYQSLKRRKERLEGRLTELELFQRAGKLTSNLNINLPELDEEDLEDLEDAPENEIEILEKEVLDRATAARSIEELRAEIETLKLLESQALKVRKSGQDTKWIELSNLLHEIFKHPSSSIQTHGSNTNDENVPPPKSSRHQKLVIFTEHRDTLNYLRQRITTQLGTEHAVVEIHGGVGREDRLKVQEAFRHDPDVHVLLATDAAGEGINLQRAHLMVNYDLPWNPNRLEQRFGRIHRIGQTEVCYLWNLVAKDTREGEVYKKLLEKLDLARQALGGQVFDVLGKIQFENNKSLRDLLLEAIRYGEQPEVQSYLTTVLDKALDRGHLQSLLDEGALANDVMDATKIQSIREEMERADAKRLQPHFIESFFLEAFKQLGGSLKQKETRRFEVTNVPSPVRTRDRMIGIREPVLQKYERIVFDKPLISPTGQIPAAFVCPGHPLLDAVTDLTIERHRDLLKRGAILVDERDSSQNPRVLFFLEHGLQDAGLAKNGERRVISKRMLFVEIDSEENERYLHYAPYLDYRPLSKDEVNVDQILDLPECKWITKELESKALSHAINNLVPEHLKEVKDAKLKLLDKTKAAVKDRLTKEITYWDHRTEELKLQESAGKINAKLNSSEARKRADALQARLEKRLKEIDLESQISPLPPVVIGGALIIPIGLLNKIIGTASSNENTNAKDTLISAARARDVIMEVEKGLGFIPIDRELEKLGYDIESKDPKTGKLRFIEVKGRIQGAATITVTRNEILYSLNKPEDFILAIVEFISDKEHNVHYVREPFKREPDFGVTSVNYDFSELLNKATNPR